MSQTRQRSVKNEDGKYTCRVTKQCSELFDTAADRDEHEKGRFDFFIIRVKDRF